MSTMLTTRNYAADLAALGVASETVQGFSGHMKEQICDQTGTSLGVAVRSIGGNETGGGIDGVPLTVAYFCPENSEEVESHLEIFQAISASTKRPFSQPRNRPSSRDTGVSAAVRAKRIWRIARARR